ncbi:protein of unknown function [Acidithiobacillus ferrivorans]|uniref:Uncharacterized protein n=1 Tax=Acidithiobacillus ferrivorans TaxID=160808 RepID=A0A060UV18_9PROT|nr:hypothetical protein AFERRI_400389 [Acidithiobacillus ferrivorans]SMH64639.1 protein of unknown function [Acidithiobacillus ferrivorans]
MRRSARWMSRSGRSLRSGCCLGPDHDGGVVLQLGEGAFLERGVAYRKRTNLERRLLIWFRNSSIFRIVRDTHVFG